MKIGIIGSGAIGSELKKMIQNDTELELAFVYDEVKEKSTVETLKEGLKKKPGLVVECASANAVLEYAQIILECSNLMVLSTSAFADEKFEHKTIQACKKFGTKVFAPSGAIIGLDGIRAVQKEITSVQITTTKNPIGFGRTDKEKKVLFEGSARNAVKLYPKNVNVSATLALNSIGFDKTKVKIVSDPNVSANTHEINIEGDFGSFYIRVQNKPSKNPKTSVLAAKTAFEMIKNINSLKPVYP